MEHRLVDPATVARFRITAEETEAVVELWRIQNRIASGSYHTAPSVPSGLIIPPQDV